MMHDDDGITQDEKVASALSRHKLLILITASIVVTLIFTAVGLVLYNTSGTAQLDLSRPGFQGVDEIVKKNQAELVEYSATGEINEEALSHFDTLYKTQLQNVTSVDAFSGDPMAPEALGIDEAVSGATE